MRKIYLLIIVLFLGFLAKDTIAQTTFNYNGGVQVYSVPAGVTTLGIDARGGCGGAPYRAGGGAAVSNGGRVQCVLTVTPGSLLYVTVGGQGGSYNVSTAPGFNGGNNGGGTFCGTGGGASDIRLTAGTVSGYNVIPYTATNRLVVAGGGGGGGDFQACGGNGGGTTGGAGCIYSTYQANGGTPTAGGTNTFSSTYNGTVGIGGIASSSSGGGGGGLYGGAGGYNLGGGGGGSSYTDPTLCTTVTHTQAYSGATGNGQVIVTVLCNSPGTIVGNPAICLGNNQTYTNPTSIVGGTWSSSNTAIGSINASTGVFTSLAAGTTTLTYTVSNPCGALATQVVTVNPLPTSITGSASVCVGTSSTLSSTPAGGLWTSSSSSATIGSTSGILSGISAGSALITYTLPTTCATTIAATVSSSPSAITGATNVCPGSSIVLSDATSGGTWSSSNTSIATVGSTTGVVTGVSGGFPTITYTSASGCIATQVINVYSLAPITGILGMCSLGTTSTLSSSTPGGTWSSSNTSVATIGSTTGVLTSVGYGTANIFYTIGSTGCVVSAVAGITPTAGGTFTVTGGGSYCADGAGVSVGLSGSTTGVSYRLNNGTGPVGPAISGTGFAFTFPGLYPGGTYYVVANQGSSCALNMSGNAVVTANALPTPYTVSGGGNFCAGGSGVHVFLNNSTIGINYQLMLGSAPVGAAIAGTSAALDFGFVTGTGTYSVVGTNTSTGCVGPMSNTVTVGLSPLPTLFTVTGSGGYCAGGTGIAPGLSGSTTGVNYQLRLGGSNVGGVVAGTGSGLTFGLQTTAGSYTVVATNTVTGCTNTMSGSANIVVNPLPTAFSVTGGGAYCSATSGVRIGLNGSTTGVNYQLYQGTGTVGTPAPGAGTALDFGVFTTAGSYTVVGVDGTTGCTTNMTGSASITINPLPASFSVTGGGSFCAGGAGVPIGLAGSVSGYSYALLNGSTIVGGASGTGGALSFGNQTNSGTYSVVATNLITGCINSMSGTASITVNTLPLVYTITSTGTAYCAGGSGVHIGLSNSTSGVNYTLLLGGSPSGSIVNGTGTAIDFGFRTGAGTYTVVATNASTLCTSNMAGTVTLSVNPLPTIYTVTGGNNYCTGGAGSLVGLNNSNTGISYQLFNGTATVGSPLAGTGAALNFGLQTLTGTYSIVATNTTTLCTSNMSGTPTIALNPLPTAYTVSASAAAYCAGGTGVRVLLSNSTAGVNYQLMNGTTLVGAPVAGNGFALDFGLQTTAGTYVVVATNATTGCTANMLGSATFTVNPVPTPYNVTGTGSYCASGTGLNVGVIASTVGVNYQLYNGFATVGAPVVGTGAALDFGPQTAAGTYTVIGTNAVTGCTSNMTGNAVITINALPLQHNVTGGGNYCFGGTGSDIMLNGSETGNNYQLMMGTSVVGAPHAGTGGTLDFGLQTAAGTYTIVATRTTTTCSVNMTGSTTIGINPLPSLRVVTGGGEYCPGGTGVHVTLNLSDVGISYQLYNGPFTSGTAIAGTGVLLDFGLKTAPGTYTVVGTNTATGCTNSMTGSATVSISAVPPVYNVTGGGNFCPAGAGVHIGLSGSNLGVTYQLMNGTSSIGTAMAGTGIALDFGMTSTTGTYTIVATSSTTGCSSNMNGSVNVGISALPATHIVTGGGNYCLGGTGRTVGLDGTETGVTYQLYQGTFLSGTPVAGTGTSIDFGVRTAAGVYTVVAKNTATTCTNNMSGSVIINVNTLPAAYTVTGGGNYCSGTGGAHVMLSNSLAGTNYQLMNGGSPVGGVVAGTGSALDFGAQTATGTYTVMATDAVTGCTNNMTGSVNVGINALPIAYAVTGGGNFCTGGTGVHVILSGTNTGITYQLYNGSAVGSPVPGTGFGLDFGLQTASGSYTVVATNNLTGCTAVMSGAATVGVSALPATFIVNSTTSNYCAGDAGVDISLSGSATGINYQLNRAGSPVGAAVAGTGSGIDFGYVLLPGIYTVTGVDGTTGCSRNMLSSVSVIVNSLPTAFTITGGGNYCSGGTGSSIGLSGSTLGILYQLYIGSTPAGTPIAGSGGAISFGPQTATGTYHVVATNPATSCTSTMSGTVTVNTNLLPTPFTVGGGGSYCAGGTGVSVNLSNSTPGIAYQLMLGTTASGSVVNGTGGGLDFGARTGAGTYTVLATNTTTGCTNTMSGSADITVTPLPASYPVTGGGNYCAGSTGVNVGLGSSSLGVTYQLFNGSVPVGSSMTGFGAALAFGLQTAAGNYTVVASDVTSGCTSPMSGSVNVGINPLPAAFNVTGGGNFCSTGTGVHVTLNGSAVGVNYQLYNALLPTGSAVPGNGTILDLGLQTAAGTYTVVGH